MITYDPRSELEPKLNKCVKFVKTLCYKIKIGFLYTIIPLQKREFLNTELMILILAPFSAPLK
jgi:hypothetical protein